MIQSGTYVLSCDNSGLLVLKLFHIYSGFYKKKCFFGNFSKFSVKKTSSSYLLTEKIKPKGIFISSKKNQKSIDGSFFVFKTNSIVVLKRSLTPLGKEMFGPVNFFLKSKSFVFSFLVVL